MRLTAPRPIGALCSQPAVPCCVLCRSAGSADGRRGSGGRASAPSTCTWSSNPLVTRPDLGPCARRGTQSR
eukprot:2076190-Prymnesium_polylepis.2